VNIAVRIHPAQTILKSVQFYPPSQFRRRVVYRKTRFDAKVFVHKNTLLRKPTVGGFAEFNLYVGTVFLMNKKSPSRLSVVKKLLMF
jgi:hypothetical protein